MNTSVILAIWGTSAGLAALGTIGAWVVLRRRRPDSLGPLLMAAIAPLPGDLFLIECLHALATRARWSPEGFWSLMGVLLWIVVGPVVLIGAAVTAAQGTRKVVLAAVCLNAIAWAIASWLGILTVVLV